MELAEQFVGVLSRLQGFDTGLYSKKLQKASKSTQCLKYFNYHGPHDVQQDGSFFDHTGCGDLVNILAAASIARCIARSSDDFGFRDSIDVGKANDLSRKTVAKLMSSLFGDYINTHLYAEGMPTLQQLSENPDFFNAYHKLLLSAPFVHNALSRNPGRQYTTALLYCFEYFKHGPGFDICEEISAESEDQKQWIMILRQWLLVSQSEEFRDENPDFRVEHVLTSVDGIVALNGYPDATPEKVAQHLTDQALGDILKWKISDDINEFRMLGQNIWASWDTATLDYQDAVVQAINAVRTETSTTQNSRGGIGGLAIVYYTYTTSYYGDDVVKYMSAFWATSLFKGSANNRVRTHQSNPFTDIFGCFRPGTQVLVGSETGKKSKSIEQLSEDDQILTRGGKLEQWGQCSGEVVQQSTVIQGEERRLLFGFNGQRPFTSASHVFHTTTGLRAIDPQGARMENPWLDVGRLRVGHQLIWTADGLSYQPVDIKSIESEPADCEYIHGVHLRQGLRSYHADGFLVHLNYPEITAKSISNMLKTIDPATQSIMLKGLKELKPLFERFGGTTLVEALGQQMTDTFTSRNPLNPLAVPAAHDLQDPQKQRGHQRKQLKHIKRQWRLQDDKKPKSLGSAGVHGFFRLPSVAIFEGVVTVDGEYCERAYVKEGTVAWSRPPEISSMGGGGMEQWEHGYFSLDHNNLMGQGRIYYSPDLDNFDHQGGRQIVALPTKQTLPKAVLRAHALEDPRARGLINPVPFATTSLFTTTAQMKAPAASIISMRAASVPRAESNQWENSEAYALSYDTADWSDTNKSVSNAAKYIDIVTAMHLESKVFAARIPSLDAIRDTAYAKAEKESGVSFAAAGDFYSCFQYVNPVSGGTVYEFHCTHPEIIAQQADGWTKEAPKYTDLTFKDIGLDDLHLPFVFSVMQVELSPDAMEASGIVREFDAKMLGDEGKRHRMLGQWTDAPGSLVRQTLASNTIDSDPGASVENMIAAHNDVPPFLLQAALSSSQPVSQDERTGANELAGLRIPSDLQKATQTLIYNVMLYHMGADDRKKFIGVEQPTVGPNADHVPADLGPNLEAGLRQWIQDKYIPAWLTQRISMMADANKDAFRRPLENKLRKRLRYWWEGKGKSCMSQDDFYNRLNAVAANYTIRRMVPRINDYLQDDNEGTTVESKYNLSTKGLNGGKRWATALFNSKSYGPGLSDLSKKAGTIMITGYNALQIIGNIMQALDPIPIAVRGSDWTKDNKPLCIRLTENVRKWRAQRGLSMAYVGSKSSFIQDEYQFIYNGLYTLWVNLINGEKGYGDEVTDKVKADMEKLMEELGIDAQWSAAQKAKSTLEVIQNMLKAAGTFSKANDDFKIGQKIENKWEGFRGRGVSGAVATADFSMEAKIDSIQDEFKSSRVKTFAYSSMVVVAMGMYIAGAVVAFKGWSSLEPGDQAKLVLGAIQQAVSTLKDCGDAWKAIMDYKAAKNRFVAASAVQESMTTDAALAEQEVIDLFGEDKALDPEMRFNEKLEAAGKNEFIEFEAREARIEVERYEKQSEIENITQEEQPAPSVEESGGDTGKVYNIKANALRIALVIIGVAIIVAMCFALYENWGKERLADQIMGIANILVQALSVLVEATVLTADMGLSVAVSALTVCAWAGPILAIVGLVLIIISLIIQATKPRPLTDSEQWMEDRGIKFVEGSLEDPPATQFAWKISPTALAPDSKSQKITITGTANKDASADIIQTRITTGTSKSSLFSNKIFEQHDASDGSAQGDNGWFYIEASSKDLLDTLKLGGVAEPPTYGDERAAEKGTDMQTPWHLRVTRRPIKDASEDGGLSPEAASITLKSGEWIRIVIQGNTGPPYPNRFYLEVDEINHDGDTVPVSAYVSRT